MSGCENITNDLTATEFDLDRLFTLDAFTGEDYEAIEASIAIFEEYDTDEVKRSQITGNSESVYFTGVESARSNIMTVLNSFDSTHPDYLAGIFLSIKTLWESVNSGYADNTSVIFEIPQTILTHFSEASAALSGSLGSSAITVYGADPATTM